MGDLEAIERRRSFGYDEWAAATDPIVVIDVTGMAQYAKSR
jgi:hypothetical protein